MGLAAGVSLGTYAARLATQTALTLGDRLRSLEHKLDGLAFGLVIPSSS